MTIPRFQFERAALGSDLEFIPLDVRYRLDIAGVKLSLAAWQSLDLEERVALCVRPVSTAAEVADFAARVERLATSHGHTTSRIEPAPTPRPWAGDNALAIVASRASEVAGRTLDHARWSALDDEQRYVLTKTAEQGKRAERFVEALDELVAP